MRRGATGNVAFARVSELPQPLTALYMPVSTPAAIVERRGSRKFLPVLSLQLRYSGSFRFLA